MEHERALARVEQLLEQHAAESILSDDPAVAEFREIEKDIVRIARSYVATRNLSQVEIDQLYAHEATLRERTPDLEKLGWVRFHTLRWVAIASAASARDADAIRG